MAPDLQMPPQADPHPTPIDQINATIDRLRQLTQLDVQPRWLIRPTDLPPSEATQPPTWTTWSPAPLNDRHHIAWPQGEQVLWLGQTIVVPAALQAYPLNGLTLRLSLTWWAAVAEIFVNGQLVQEGDLFDHSARIVLSPAVTPGETIAVALRLVSPGHDPGALVRSHLIFEPTQPQRPDPGMIADELAVLQGYISRFRPENLTALAAATTAIDWETLAAVTAFDQSLDRCRHQLQPWQSWLQARQISWVGHAHLDLAWLWPVAETWEAAERTFKSVLQLQQDFPELIFGHSSPALYAWCEAHRPELFQQIQKQVTAGRWEVAAGLWVEPELNLVSGESLVRQVLYGQRYVQDKFGSISLTAWLPDSFGFCWQLPQILKQGGVEYFLTQKLRWNDSTEFPHEVFWWRSPDGTDILSIMLPPIGEGIDAVKMATYAQDWEAKTGLTQSLWLPGVGDHGGGPTRDMLAVGRRWQQSACFPQLKPTTAAQFCHQVQTQAPDLPVWQDELYLEFHRGCYTSHADQKRFNRRCEHLLCEAELFAAIATLTLDRPYPQAELEQAWKQVLFNQFHDILPGSSIPQVFVDANRDWQAAEETASHHLDTALGAIAQAIALPPPPTPKSIPVVVFNSLNWERSEIVNLPWPQDFDPESSWQVFDSKGHPVLSQLQVTADPPTILFEARGIPAIGYCTYWLSPQTEPEQSESISPPQGWILENEALRIEVDPDTGNLQRVFDKINQKEVLSGPGNQLQFFADQGQYWDAWNIDPDYAHHPLPAAQLTAIKWMSWGPLQQRLRMMRCLGQSQFCQEYVLERNASLLKIETTVDWQERQVLVKAAFPLTVTAEVATYEIPCGAIARPTLPNPQPLDPREQAKWEVPALQWADLTQDAPESGSESAYGVSLLNDCKYGYDAQPNQLRITLLRSPNWPDPECDRGHHRFTYALYPHAHRWQVAHTVHRGYELNRPLRAFIIAPSESASSDRLPPQQQFIDLSAQNVFLMAFKRSEDDLGRWILRCYEGQGETAALNLQNQLNLMNPEPVDLLEQRSEQVAVVTIGPWQIQSVAFEQQTA